MMDEFKTITVRISGREFNIKCKASEIPALEEARDYVDDKIRAMREKDNLASNDAIAIVTALNVAHELIQIKKTNEDLRIIKSHISKIKNKVRAITS